MKILLANDHAGVSFKNALKVILKNLLDVPFEFSDLGCDDANIRVDYPVYARKLSLAVLESNASIGIGICGTGLGISMACNRFKGIRAALVYDLETARLAKQHNDANIICFGARKTTVQDAADFFKEFLSLKFEHGRHEKRIELLDLIN